MRSNAELQAVKPDTTDYLIGLFGETHIRFGDERIPDEDPSLAEMTLKAIEVINGTKSRLRNRGRTIGRLNMHWSGKHECVQ